MTNFKILFEHPWLLLLLIPAFAVTLYFYFRISKRYRTASLTKKIKDMTERNGRATN